MQEVRSTISEKSLLQALRLDRKNNSTKSFLTLLIYRVSHYLYIRHHKLLLWLWEGVKNVLFFFFQIDAQISYKAVIGNNIRLLHRGNGVVISAKAILGDNITIYHQVTIGINENKPENQQVIRVMDNCYLSTGCKIISCTVGECCKIGPNAVVFKDLPAGSLYVSSNQLLR